MFGKIKVFLNKVTAKNRAVAAGGNINAPVFTGDIHDSKINIDQKSFAQSTFLAQASAFDESNDRIPLLWTTYQCLSLLSNNNEIEGNLKFKILKFEDDFMVQLIGHKASHLNVLYFKAKGGDIGCKELNTILKNIPDFALKISSKKIFFNKDISPDVNYFWDNASKGNFKTKIFNKKKESFTGLSLELIRSFVKNATLEKLFFRDNYFTPYICTENSRFVSELTKALAINLLSKQSSDAFVEVKRHDLEVRFGAEHYNDIFPSPPKFEASIPPNLRNHQELILKSIFDDKKNTIIHARGGVGKTVMARLAHSVAPEHSCVIVYDCFGDGLYRSLNNPRHSFDKVLVQIINELAIEGICDPLVSSGKDRKSLVSEFQSRLEVAVQFLRKGNELAQLYVFIDAADNAVMAAKEKAENSIIPELLNSLMIDGCTVVALCRSERIELLSPRAEVRQHELSAFTENESLAHLRLYYSGANEEDAKEFHRLSGGNPRVQSYAIQAFPDSLSDMLQNLGPTLTTVDAQIEVQLEHAIERLKSKNVSSESVKIDLICTALASLPPFIPISVISKLTNLREAEIGSFISDFGQGLILIDDSIQFRDEPTETWFRKQYASTSEQAKEFVLNIRELASSDSYVSECLPYLMLAGGNHQDLIDLALSEEFLPIDNPIDTRSISTSRLNAALKSALKLQDYVSFVKLALRTGEEFAGDQRQIDLLNQNAILISAIQSPTEVQKLAFQGKLAGDWKGSENLYKSSLLSVHQEFKGESLSYLRAAENWLAYYFKSKASEKNRRRNEGVSTKEVALLFTTYLNLFGAKKTIERILNFTPSKALQKAIEVFSKNLVDESRFDEIKDFSFYSREFGYICIHFICSLYSFQVSLNKEIVNSCFLNITKIDSDEVNVANKTIQNVNINLFIECCLANGLDRTLLYSFFQSKITLSPKPWFANPTMYHNGDLHDFVEAAALMTLLSGVPLPDNSIFPKEFLADDLDYKKAQEKEKYRKTLDATIPAQCFLIQVRSGIINDFSSEYETTFEQVSKNLPPSYELRSYTPELVKGIKQKCLFSAKSLNKEQQILIFSDIAKEASYNLLLDGLYYTCRVEHLHHLASLYENPLISTISAFKKDGPESTSSSYIDTAIAVCPLSKFKSAEYFNKAIESASKFGDEALMRHSSILSLAEKSSEESCSAELTYRFSRSSEVIYEYMSDHFPIDKTMKAIQNMNSSSAFAIMARWLDREVTYWGVVEDTIIRESFANGVLAPEEAWCAQGLVDESEYIDFIIDCIEKTKSENVKKIIFDDAARQSLIKGFSEKMLSRIQKVGDKFGLSSPDLVDAIHLLKKQNRDKLPTKQSLGSESKEQEIDWSSVFRSNNFTSSDHIENSLGNFNRIKNGCHINVFWEQVYLKVPTLSSVDFIRSILRCKSLSKYELQSFLESTPIEWLQHDDFKKVWLQVFDLYVENNASLVSSPWWVEQSTSRFPLKEDFAKLRCNGVIKALEAKSDFDDAEFIFSVISVVSDKLSPTEARDALSYALDRVELHIDQDDADGSWDHWLEPSCSTPEAYASFIWSLISNPTSKICWEGVHIIYRLVECGCDKIIDSLILLFPRNDNAAFASNKFRFYKHHAQLYFLIAMLRGAKSNPATLLRYSSFFIEQATSADHILLEHYASKVAFELLQKDSTVYSTDEICKLKEVGKSQFGKNILKSRDECVDVNIASSGEDIPDVSFFLDFQEYWLKPLANVFNVSVKSLKQAAMNIVINEWGISPNDQFFDDPRSYGRKETHSRHYSIPPTQRFDFYLGYHVVFTLASRLIKNIPIAQSKNDWEGDRWFEWLSGHLLSTDNGYLLADLRDPAPLIRRGWLEEIVTESWRWEILDCDFFEGLLLKHKEKTFVCVTGLWADTDGRGNNEEYRISSALVSPSNSDSLLKALVTCKNSHDYKLPTYEEERFELDDHDFQLKGWIVEPDSYKRFDEIDPYAGELQFPSKRIGSEYEKLLQLSYCSLSRTYTDILGNKHGFSETWTDTHTRYNEGIIRKGDRVYMSLDMLKTLCIDTELSLIFEVSISRQSSTFDKDLPTDVKYSGQYCNLYTLSRDGVIKDYQSRCYQLR
ncbi:hypothetical protein [Vibrio coralliilyticus]|uniref:hypothetical protein n=1 Tax=Vibrio coralliilyticus TaxID=190893 RepID=UPI00345E1B94